MLQNVINSIIEAEAEADKIVKDATAESKEMFASIKAESEKMIKDNADAVRDKLKAINEEANTLADTAYDKIIADGEETAKKLFASSQEAIHEASDFIAGRLLEKYGNS